MDHYYSAMPDVASDPKSVQYRVLGMNFTCTTDSGVFCRDGLDMGTRILLEALPETLGDDLLDLGCGWGPVGIALGKKYPQARIVMSDVNARAVALAQKNCAANGVHNAQTVTGDAFENIEGAFSAIVLNPPIRAGKAVIYALFEQAKAHLTADGALYIVMRKQQGAESAQRYLQSLYATVERISRDKGYWVLRCSGGIKE